MIAGLVRMYVDGDVLFRRHREKVWWETRLLLLARIWLNAASSLDLKYFDIDLQFRYSRQTVLILFFANIRIA